MKRLSVYIVVLLLTGILFYSCSGEENIFERYEFSYNPPYINARIDEVFPVSMKNTPRKVWKLDMPEGYKGFEASYIDGKITMRVLQCPDERASHTYFGSVIIEEFKKKKRRVYNNLDNRWKAFGTDKDGRQWLAWVNTSWVFVISGADDETFDLVVRACRFVSKGD